MALSDFDYGRQQYAQRRGDVDALIAQAGQMAGLPIQSSEGLQNFVASQLAIGRNAQQILPEILTGQASGETRAAIQQQGNLLYGPQLGQIGNAETQANRAYEDLTKTLTEQATKQKEGFYEDINRRGLFRSGVTLKGISDIESNLYQDTARAAQDKAYNLAQLALQRAGLINKQALFTQQTQAGIGEAVQKLLNPPAPQTALRTIAGRDVLVNMETGDIMKDYGAVPRASSGGGGGGRSLTAGQQQGNVNDAVNRALDAMAQADIMNVNNPDRLLSAEEKQSAQQMIVAIAQQYGIDPQQLFDLAWQQGGFQDWSPSQGSAPEPTLFRKIFGQNVFGRG